MGLNINGTELEVTDIDEATPLLGILRDRLGLLGTQYGCGVAQFGHCQAGQIMPADAYVQDMLRAAEAQSSIGKVSRRTLLKVAALVGGGLQLALYVDEKDVAPAMANTIFAATGHRVMFTTEGCSV